jgi:methyl-accepting chemotaxis protein
MDESCRTNRLELIMLKLFRENAPIYRKMSIAFGAQSGLIAICLGAQWFVLEGSLSAEIALEICGAMLAVSVALGVVLREAVAAPYVTTVLRMEGLAAGDLESPIQFTSYTDCVGRITKAMFTFRKTALDKVAADKAMAATLAERKIAEETDAAIAAQTVLVAGSIGSGLTHLANGDLTFRLNDVLPEAYERLRADFNTALVTLQATIQSIGASTQAVRSGAEEITQASDDLSRRTEQQAASLEQTAAALDEITATVRKTAEGAKEAREVVAAAKTDAERSGEVVKQTVAAMSGIENSSKQISNIIGVIDEIAFQTNLLALNAGVEAARAGDAGRGFAVVATEVRALAQRSADAAKEIKALISASGAQVASGVTLVGETGKALGRTLEQVEQLNRLVSDIAASAQEQATGLHQVNTAVNQMDQVTQQNAAMVEQATAASHSLAGEAAELARLVEQFQTGAVIQAARQAAPRPVAARPATAKPRIPAAAPMGKFAPAPRAAAAPADNWDEF